MKIKIFINRLSVVLLLFTITILPGQVFADTPDELVEQGKNELFNNVDPWTALIKFNEALVRDPNHQKANFWRAVTVGFSNTELIALLQSLDIIDASNKWLIFDAEGELDYNPFISGEDIIVDDSDAVYVGVWNTAIGGFNDSYHWREAGAGATATWTPAIPANGKYQVYARWVALDGNTTDAAYTINPAVGNSQTITVDQSHDSDKWISLGIYEFSSGAGNTIKLAESPDGKVAADAIKVVPLRPYPNLTEAQDLLTSLVDPPGEQIEQALANLSHVDNTFSDTVNLSDSDTMHLDYGEVKAVETLFYLTETLTNISAAYNMNNADILKIALLEPDPISLLNEYTDAGKLLPGAAARLGKAKIALEKAITSYLAASDYIRNVRTDSDGLNHLTRFYPLYDPEAYDSQEEWEEERDGALTVEEDIRNFLNDINAHLTGRGNNPWVKLFFPEYEVGETMGPGIDIFVDFYEFFTAPKDIRVFVDGLLENDIIRDNLADRTFGGVFPKMTPPDWNYLLGNGPNFKDDPTVRWNGDAPLVELKWKKVLDQHEAAFLRYKIYRSTTPDVDSSSDLVETINNPLTDTFTDDTIDGLSNFYYYRLYTYYDFAGETAETYSEVGKIILRIYVDAGYAGGSEDGTKEHPFSDLGDAIDEASNGTKVCVARGAYHESDASLRMWNKDGLVLEGGYESTNWTRNVAANVTTIDGTGQGGWNVVSFNNVEGGVLDGFTIIGGLMRDGACGIQLSRAASIVIRNCKVINNERGIGIWDMSSCKVENCWITGSAHQGINVDMSSLEISDSTISGNDTNLEEWTSAIDVYLRGALTAARLDVSQNNGRGITLSNFSSFDIRDSRIAGNLGRGFDSRNSYGKFFNNLVVNNGKTGVNCGGFDEEGQVFAENNTVVGNGENGGIVCERAFPWLELDNQRGGEYFTSAGNWARFFDGNANWGEYLLCEAGSGAFATWTPDIKTAGAYKVYATWVAGAAHSSDAAYEIRYDGGTTMVSVDQKTGTTGWQGRLLGQYRFAQGKAGSIVLHQSSSGQVVADAIKIEYIPSGSETFTPTIRNNIATANNRGSNKRGITSYTGANPVVSYNDVYGNTDGNYAGAYTNGGGNISIDPKFVDSPLGEYYLSQTASWQSEDSPCVDAGDPAENPFDANYTTRTNGQADTGRVDMGYHYSAGLNSLSAVVINEFLPNPAGGNGGNEWVELYNRDASPIDISGCIIDDIIGGGSDPQTIPASTIIPAHGFYTVDLPGTYLNNSGDTVNFLWPNGETRVDSYTYGSTIEGHSYYRYVDGGNWAGDMDDTPTRNAANDGPTQEKGDINNDGKISSADAIKCLRFAVGLGEPTQAERYAADMNNDGRISSADAIKILRKAVGLE